MSNRSDHERKVPWGRLRGRVPAGWLCVVVALCGCTMQRPLELPAARRDDAPSPRKPDGVAVDLEGTLPEASAQARTSERLVVLQEPVAYDAAMEAVRAFFQAVRGGDMPRLRQTISTEATQAPLGAAAGPPAEAQWERRMRKFDYRTLGGGAVFHESSVEIYRYDDLDEVIGDRPARPSLMSRHDVLIRVPIATTRLGVDRVFGDEMRFVVRRAERTYRIQAIYEDFQVP